MFSFHIINWQYGLWQLPNERVVKVRFIYTHRHAHTHAHPFVHTYVFVHNGSEILIYLVDIVVHTQLISLLP